MDCDLIGKNWIITSIEQSYNNLKKISKSNEILRAVYFNECYTFVKTCYLFNVINKEQYVSIIQELHERNEHHEEK